MLRRSGVWPGYILMGGSKLAAGRLTATPAGVPASSQAGSHSGSSSTKCERWSPLNAGGAQALGRKLNLRAALLSACFENACRRRACMKIIWFISLQRNGRVGAEHGGPARATPEPPGAPRTTRNAFSSSSSARWWCARAFDARARAATTCWSQARNEPPGDACRQEPRAFILHAEDSNLPFAH
jgi:hypothetical protein